MKVFSKRVVLFVVVGCLTACVTMPPQSKPRATSNSDYLLDSTSATLNPKTLIEDLDRTVTVAGVHISALPLSGALMETEAKDKAFKEALSQHELERLLSVGKKLNKDKVCFVITFNSENQEGTILKYWGLELVDQHLNKHPLKFLEPDSTPEAKTEVNVSSYTSSEYFDGTYYHPGQTHTYTTNTTHHTNGGTACTTRDKNIDFSKNFAIHFTPRFERDLRPVDVVWLQTPKTQEEVAAETAEKAKRTRSGPGIP